MSSSRVDLKVDWCSYEAAKYAVEHWHYSQKMPMGKLARLGVWEQGRFIGAIVFGTGAAPQAHVPYGVTRFEICELVRVALSKHRHSVTQMIRLSLSKLRGVSRGLRLIVSYADPEHSHVGAIYQAGNWVYVGKSEPKWRANGQHNRVFGTSMKRARAVLGADVSIVWELAKHKYLYPLDRAMRRQIAPLAQPYPKRAGG